jgi:DNA-binding NtrC family response regulator
MISGSAGLRGDDSQTELARRIQSLSIDQWGERKRTVLIGLHETSVELQRRLLQYAQAESPVLITGETGTGKELYARALYLLSARRRKPFLSINCAQYHDGQLIASELFGHRRGAFTGAVADHRGVFEEADGGVVFLDELGELSFPAQAMLLRTLSEGELIPVGDTRPRSVDVRVIAATSRDLRAMVAAGQFREDLYFRLRFLQLRVPPLRERGEDWELMLRYYLELQTRATGAHKRFSAASYHMLSEYGWPGNVRELRGVVDSAFHGSERELIEPPDFAEELEVCRPGDVRCSPPVSGSRNGNGMGIGEVPAGHRWPAGDAPALAAQSHPFGIPVVAHADARHPASYTPPAPGSASVGGLLTRMLASEGTFWTLVHDPYMQREINRIEVRQVVAAGLRQSGGSYKRLLSAFGVAPSDYLRFMDFLRHHKLKPDR